MQRFYKQVGTGPAVGGGYAVLLDGRPVRTPEKHLMAAPTAVLAEAIAREWDAQDGQIAAESMPLSQMLTTAIDRMDMRGDIADNALQYLQSDLLCYRADEPEGLVAEQSALWDVWLDWFSGRFGTRLATTTGLVRIDQDAGALTAARAFVDGLDAHAFTVFQITTGMTGSAVLGMAMAAGDLAPEDAWRCALCEELYFERVHDLERHGLDPIEDKRRTGLRRELDAAQAYLKSTRI